MTDRDRRTMNVLVFAAALIALRLLLSVVLMWQWLVDAFGAGAEWVAAVT